MYSLVCLVLFLFLFSMWGSKNWLNVSIKTILFFMAVWSLVQSWDLLLIYLK